MEEIVLYPNQMKSVSDCVKFFSFLGRLNKYEQSVDQTAFIFFLLYNTFSKTESALPRCTHAVFEQ